MKIGKICLLLGLLCGSFAQLPAEEAQALDATSQSVLSFYQLPMSDEGGRIINTIVSSLVEDNYFTLIRRKGEMERLGDRIEYKVHPLRFLGYIFASPKLKQYMVTVRRDPFKWRGFMGSTKRRGVVKNMTREMKKRNILPHLRGFCHHVGADYERIFYYVEREDYHGMVKYLIKHQ